MQMGKLGDDGGERIVRAGSHGSTGRVGCLSDAVDLADRYWAFYRESAQMWNIDRGDVDQVAAFVLH